MMLLFSFPLSPVLNLLCLSATLAGSVSSSGDPTLPKAVHGGGDQGSILRPSPPFSFNLTKSEVTEEPVLIYQKLQKTGSTHLEALILAYARENHFSWKGIYKASSQLMTQDEQVFNYQNTDLNSQLLVLQYDLHTRTHLHSTI